MLKAANYSYNTNKLPTSQTKGILALIPKGDQPKDKLTNWRPITLLSTVYKLISGVVANRISTLLPKLINSDQSGFVKGRYIGECLRTTYDIVEWAKNKQRIGLLLLIDFEKAFDSISFKYIIKTLKFFKFGQSLQKWVILLLNNFKASICHAGNISAQFDILRGCRQGDPIASILFILCIEIMAIKLRGSNEIKGYKMDNLENLLSLYADDRSIFLEYNATNLRNS